jgi:hypothetical protein
MQITRLRTRLPMTLVCGALATGLASAATPAQAASLHPLASFGRSGVAGLPVRERRQEQPNQGAPPPPERDRSLLAPGPQGSVFVGGYAQSRPGAFLLARVSASGRLVRGFGDGGVISVSAVRWRKQDPPRLLALPGGGLLVVGLNQADQLAVVRVSALGRLVSGFGKNGVAQYTLAHARRLTIVTAATVEPDGDVLAVYQRELPQPPNGPRVPEGQGNGHIGYVRLLATGALDTSFGKGGFLVATGEKAELGIEGESGTVGACGETLATDGTLLVAYEGAALEELSPAGAVVPSFGDDRVEQTATVVQTKNPFSFCLGMFALAGDAVEGISGLESGAKGATVTRLTPAGKPESAFGAAGATRIDITAEAAAVAPDGETFAVGQSAGKLVVAGVLTDGQLDAALGGAGGERFAVNVPRAAGTVPGDEERPTWEVLPIGGGLTIRVGEELVRLGGQ